MKCSILNMCFLAIVIAICSCTPKQPDSGHLPTGGQDPMPLDSVLKPLATAQADIENFDTLSSYIIRTVDSITGHTSPRDENTCIKAFTVRAVDLYAAMGVDQASIPNTPYDHIRVYLGYSTESHNFKLYIVPVNGADVRAWIPGEDLTLNANGSPEPGGTHVLDLNAPCPNLCDQNSPLVSQ